MAVEPADAADRHEDVSADYDELIRFCRPNGATSTGEAERIERVKLLLVARGITPRDEAAAAWLAPVLCTNPEEQIHFHTQFAEYLSHGMPSSLAPQATQAADPVPMSRVNPYLRKEMVLAAAMPAVLAAAFFLLHAPEKPASQPHVVSVNVVRAPIENLPVPTHLQIHWPSIAILLLMLIAAAAAYAAIRRRRERLLESVSPAAKEAAAMRRRRARANLFSSSDMARMFTLLRRHKETPSRKMDVRRTVKASIKAMGRPCLRFGSRPTTPEYVLLVDCQSPHDHFTVMGDALQQRFADEKILAFRFEHVGKPDRVQAVDEDAEQTIAAADVIALHDGARIIALAEARDCAREQEAGTAFSALVTQLDQPTLLDPRGPRSWTGTERALEEGGMLVVPASRAGLEWYAEAVNIPGLKWPGRWPLSNSFEEDPTEGLLAAKRALLSDTSPPPRRVAEVLTDLRHSLGENAFRLLSAIAVYPAADPCFTLHVGAALTRTDGGTLLDERTWMALARLPWMRLGHIPMWLRTELVRGLDAATLARTTSLVESFVLPEEAEGSGRTSGASDESRRQIQLLAWIGRHPESALYDPLLFDALRGRPPAQVARPRDPDRPGRPLNVWRRQDVMLTATLLAGLGAIAYADPPLQRVPIPTEQQPPPIVRPDAPTDFNASEPPIDDATNSQMARSSAIDVQLPNGSADAEGGSPPADLPPLEPGNRAYSPRRSPAPPPPATIPGPFMVYFDFDKSDIMPEAAAILDNAVATWKALGDRNAQVMIAGHTDRYGSAPYNVALSQRQADSVRAYLAAHGIPDGVMTTQAFGESRPLVQTADGVREPQNRRVEITFGPPAKR